MVDVIYSSCVAVNVLVDADDDYGAFTTAATTTTTIYRWLVGTHMSENVVEA